MANPALKPLPDTTYLTSEDTTASRNYRKFGVVLSARQIPPRDLIAPSS